MPLPGYTSPKCASSGACSEAPREARITAGSPGGASAMLEPIGISVIRRATHGTRRRTIRVTSSLAATTRRALVRSQSAAARERRVPSSSVWTVTTVGMDSVAYRARRRSR